MSRWTRWARHPRRTPEPLGVELEQTPKRPYRELLDWFTAQVDRLDAHARQVAAYAEHMTEDELAAQCDALEQAHVWLTDQLADALAQRGMAVAA